MSRFLNFAWLQGGSRQDSGNRPSSREWSVVFFLLAACLIFNMATCRLYPAEWSDEVSYSEPAVNFAQTGSFTTRVWAYQPVNTFPVTNCPLYPMSLAVWLSLVGTSLLAVRAFNYALAGGVVFLSWVCSWKSGLVRRPASRLALVLLMELGYGVSTAFRSSRPDMLAAFLLLLLALSFGIGHQRWRTAGMIFLAAAIVWTALQVALAAAFAAFIAWLFFRRFSFKDMVAVALGMMLGALLLILFLNSHQVLPYFLDTITSVTGHRKLSALSLVSVNATVVKSLLNYVHDFSLLPVIFGCLLFWMAGKKWTGQWLARPALFLLVLIACIPALLNALGHFVIFYSHLVFLPACLLFLMLRERAVETATPASRRRLNAVFAVIIGLACAAGLPLRLGLAEKFYDIGSRNQMMESLRQQIHPADVVFTDYQAFFDVKQIAPVVYVPDESAAWDSESQAKRPLTGAERSSVTILVVNPEDANYYTQWLGGQWEAVGRPFGDRMNVNQAAALPVIGKSLASYFNFEAPNFRSPLEILRRKNVK